MASNSPPSHQTAAQTSFVQQSTTTCVNMEWMRLLIEALQRGHLISGKGSLSPMGPLWASRQTRAFLISSAVGTRSSRETSLSKTPALNK